MKKKVLIPIICLVLMVAMSACTGGTVTEEKISLVEKMDSGEVRSVEITFNSNKLMVSDENYESNVAIALEMKNDVASVLDITLEDFTVQELYEKTVNQYGTEPWSVSEMREGTVAGFPAYFFDQMMHGAVYSQYFVIDMGNGLSVHNQNVSGYRGNVSLEEIMAHGFLEMKEGDGTLIRPEEPYTIEDDGDVYTISFDSGESCIVDYDENVVDGLFWGRFEWARDDDFVPDARMVMYITNKYDSIEEFDAGEAKLKPQNWSGGLSSKTITLNGQTIDYIDDAENEKAIFIVPLKEGYSLRGVYEYWPYDEKETGARSIEEVLTSLFGGGVK